MLTTLTPYLTPTYNPRGLSPQGSMSATSSVTCPAGGTLTASFTASSSETSLALTASLKGPCRVNQPEPTALDNVNLAFQGNLTFSADQNSLAIQGRFTEAGGFTLEYKGNTHQVSDLSLNIPTTDTFTFSHRGTR